MGKQVLVMVRHSPCNDARAREAVRMALGLEIADHAVTVAFVDAGAGAALACRPEEAGQEPWAEHLEMLCMLGHRLWVEEESLARLGLPRERLFPGVEAVPRAAIEAAVLAADVALAL